MKIKFYIFFIMAFYFFLAIVFFIGGYFFRDFRYGSSYSDERTNDFLMSVSGTLPEGRGGK